MILNCSTIADFYRLTELGNNESIIIEDEGFTAIITLPIDNWLYARAALFLATDDTSITFTNIEDMWGKKSPNWIIKSIHVDQNSITVGTNRKLRKRERDKWSGEIIDLGLIPEDVVIRFEVIK